MNTQKYGIECFSLYKLATRWLTFCTWKAGLAVADYTRNRTNGDEKWDIPDHQFPKDGHYNWIKGEERDGRVYGELQEDGRYAYEVRYDEGPGDRAWMEERDRKYVFRLEREGILDQVEPNLCTEVPLLYEEVMKYRVESTPEFEAEAKIEIEVEPQKEEYKSVELKTQNYGISGLCDGPAGRKPLPIPGFNSQAFLEYVKNRENGTPEDNPDSVLPADGKFTWETPNERLSKIRYKEGPGDKKWMKAKDQNYLNRLAREKKIAAEKEIEQITLTSKVKELTQQLQEKDTKITDLHQELSTLEKNFNEVKTEAEQIVAAVTERKTEVESIPQTPQEPTDFLTQFKTLMESKNEWQTDENLNLEKRLAEIQQDQQKQAEALDKNRNDLQAQIKELKENQVEDRTVQAQQNIALHCLEAKIETLETRYEVKNIQKLIDNIRKEFSKQLDTEDKKYQLLFKKEREKVWSALTRDIEEKEEKHMEKIVDLEIKLDCLKENESQQTEEIKKIEAELTQVHTGQECLMQDYRIKQKLLAEQREICRYPELRYFYQCVQLKLVEVFLATKSIASGMIDAPVSLKVQGAQKVIELAGEAVPIPGAGAAGGLLSSGLGFFAQKKSEKKKKLQSSLLGTMNDIEIVAESVARSLTHRYTEQLLQLTPEGSRLLGECAIARMINYLEDHLDLLAYGAEPEQAKSNLVTSLLSSLYRVKMKQKYWGICNRDIPTKEGGLNWTESGILTEPGIRCVFQTPSGQREERYYGSGKKEIRLKPGPDAKINFSIKTRPEKYGYRRGTVREAEDLRLSWSPHRGPQRAEHLMQLKFHEQLSQLLREGTTEEKHELIDQLASRHQQSPPSPW